MCRKRNLQKNMAIIQIDEDDLIQTQRYVLELENELKRRKTQQYAFWHFMVKLKQTLDLDAATSIKDTKSLIEYLDKYICIDTKRLLKMLVSHVFKSAFTDAKFNIKDHLKVNLQDFQLDIDRIMPIAMEIDAEYIHYTTNENETTKQLQDTENPQI